MSDGVLRAQFTFGSKSEVRYIAALPEVGDYVAHGRELWRVSSAEMDGLGLIVVCQRPAPTADDADADRV